MEKLCEFCAALRPVIYCKADAAHLCLTCDAKVHSANALSNRHLRTLLCELCKTRPTHVHCFNHQLFLCHWCDQNLHKASSHHQKRAIRSYMGCPSAKEFARFWGFDSTEFESKGRDLFLPATCVSAKSTTVNLDISAPYLPARLHSSSLSHHQKVSYKCQDKSTSIILHQIFDLERLQLTKENNKTHLIRGEEKNGVNSSETIQEVFDHDESPNSQHFGTNIPQKDNPLKELNADPLCFPFSQPEFLPSSAVVNGESLWPYKSPVECSQLWSQNMQDLGVCDDFVRHDDFDIPDVDLTFRNFEELFGGDQDQTRGRLGDEDLSFSSVAKDVSPDRTNNLSRRKEDGLMASSGLLDCHGRGAKSSYCLSSVEHVPMKKLGEDSSTRRRNKEKKSRRLEKQIECSSKRWGDDFQKRVKGLSGKTEGYDASAKLNATKSF